MKILNFINDSNSITNSKNIFNFKNTYLNWKTARLLTNKFSDFSEFYFPEQMNHIYDEVTIALERKEFPILMRSIYGFTNKVLLLYYFRLMNILFSVIKLIKN